MAGGQGAWREGLTQTSILTTPVHNTSHGVDVTPPPASKTDCADASARTDKLLRPANCDVMLKSSWSGQRIAPQVRSATLAGIGRVNSVRLELHRARIQNSDIVQRIMQQAGSAVAPTPLQPGIILRPIEFRQPRRTEPLLYSPRISYVCFAFLLHPTFEAPSPPRRGFSFLVELHEVAIAFSASMKVLRCSLPKLARTAVPARCA